jgi:hypothetical protein
MADLGRAALKKASNGRDKQKDGSRAPNEQNGANSSAASTVPPSFTESSLAHVPDYRAQRASLTSAPIPAPALPTPEMSGIGNNMTPPVSLDPSISPDWLNFDTAFENFDAVLGSSGADLSMELLRPFNFEEFGSYEFPK